MDLILARKSFREDGIFGELIGPRGSFLMVTLERSFPSDDGFFALLPVGSYTCKRGIHHLSGKDRDGVDILKEIETFEVMDVPGHTGILFHVGNYNLESKGCILLGTQIGNKSDGGKMIVNSNVAWRKFMTMQEGENEFKLTVE